MTIAKVTHEHVEVLVENTVAPSVLLTHQSLEVLVQNTVVPVAKFSQLFVEVLVTIPLPTGGILIPQGLHPIESGIGAYGKRGLCDIQSGVAL